MRGKKLMAFAIVAIVAAVSVGSAAADGSDIDTTPLQNRSLCSWGTEGTPTYGQTLTGTGSALTTFSFMVDMYPGDAINFEGGVAEWDGGSFTATSVLWQGDRQTIAGGDSDGGSPTFDLVTITLDRELVLADGETYVIYLTVLGVPNTGANEGCWGGVRATDPYAGGYATYNNARSVLGSWRGGAWANDFAFIATFGSLGSSDPEHRGYCSVAGNTNPYTGAAITPGTFLILLTDQPASSASYTGAVPANYLQGVGISCDNPAGYTKTTTTVGYAGAGDPGPYPYYTEA